LNYDLNLYIAQNFPKKYPFAAYKLFSTVSV